MTDVLHKNVNRIAEYLDKPSDEFTRQDLIKFITNNNIRMLKFRYIGDEGKLKTLNFIIHSKDQLDRLLAMGERVDGSSLLPYIDAGSSDIYVLPRYKTAYVNPFSEIPVEFLKACRIKILGFDQYETTSLYIFSNYLNGFVNRELLMLLLIK